MMGNLATLLAELGPRWPGCADELTTEVAFGLRLSQTFYNLNTAASAEGLRIQANEAIAAAFEQVDFVIAATNPGPAFAADAVTSAPQSGLADWVLSTRAGAAALRGVLAGTRVAAGAFPKLPPAILETASRRFPDLVNMGALTIPANLYGNPAVSIPAGTMDGLPLGLQVMARHHADALLLDLALAAERHRPWPLVAPGVAATLAGV
jgi:aspartyl-tRNA(Asn)/glutamyl-tRNA(Gln) amidotransferase subunit A